MFLCDEGGLYVVFLCDDEGGLYVVFLCDEGLYEEFCDDKGGLYEEFCDDEGGFCVFRWFIERAGCCVDR